MSFTSSGGVTGPRAHQELPNIAGNNLDNVNTTDSKAGRATFSELLNEKIRKTSQPASGVGIAGISPGMSQGNIINTGNPLDLAVEGQGYFVLSDSQQNIYTRAGSFAVDANSRLVDPATGYHVQRIGSEGEIDGFQTPGTGEIHVPYDAAMPARATSEIIVSGNLSADAAFAAARTQVITSNVAYTYDNGTAAAETTAIDQLDQFGGGSGTGGQLGASESGTITISGYHPDGTALGSDLTFTVGPTTTVGDLINHLNTNILTGATASLINGQIRITDNTSGYSRTDMTLSYSGDGSLRTPAYFEISTVGGEEVKSANITAYDSQGDKHALSGAFVRTNTANTWDMVLTSITGDIHQITMANRRIEDITFDANDGSYTGLGGSDSAQFAVTLAHDISSPQTIQLSLGTVKKLDGLTQFAGNSTAVATEQNGYEAGRLATVSVNNEGMVIGEFSNGIKKNIATIQIALFQNTSGLEHVGSGYYIPSANSGQAVAAQAMTGGAGSIHGGALEKSSADVATEFVNMIQAQNGFHANARSIRVANDILRELAGLIR